MINKNITVLYKPKEFEEFEVAGELQVNEYESIEDLMARVYRLVFKDLDIYLKVDYE